MNKKTKNSTGITMVGLVVTVILLLIIAGISVSLIVSDNGILNKAKNAKENTEQSEKKENEVLTQLGTYIDSVTGAETTPKNDSLIGYIRSNEFNNNSYNDITINGEIYKTHIYSFSGDQQWTSSMTFGDANDIGTQTTYAQNMVIVKVNGNLTINSGVTVSTYSSIYGGPKGFLLLVTGTITNNGTISATAKGAYAQSQNVYLWKNSNDNYEFVPAIGALGGAGTTAYRTLINGNKGIDGTMRQTGGGGSGCNGNIADYSHTSYVSRGGNGTSYSGGSGSGGYSANVTQSQASSATYWYARSGIGNDFGGVGRICCWT